MILVAMSFANNVLDARMAENEFTTNKQFMLTTGLQIDDIAWTIGRAQTVRYSSRYGQVMFQNETLTYSIEVMYGGSSEWQQVFNYQTGIILYNMPSSEYTLGNNYFERIFPTNDSFVQSGTSAPVSHVYVVEKLPMSSGSFTRVAISPTIRMLNSSIDSQSYVKVYLPSLQSGTNPRLSQSITLIGKMVTHYMYSNVDQIQVTVTFPKESQGFSSDFFQFTSDSMTLNSTSVPAIPPGSVVEFYVGEVGVSLGLYI